MQHASPQNERSLQDAPEHHSTPGSAPLADAPAGKRFHGWRLLGVIGLAIVLMGAVALAVDITVIGPLEGRW